MGGRLADIEHLRASDRDGMASNYVPLHQMAIDGRRLAIADGLDQEVRTHAQTLLESMHDQIGDDMPAAPARMLSMFGSSSPSSSGAKKLSFMTCLMKAAPSPTKATKCIADNFSSFCKMAMNMLRAKPREARIGSRCLRCKPLWRAVFGCMGVPFSELLLGRARGLMEPRFAHSESAGPGVGACRPHFACDVSNSALQVARCRWPVPQ